MASAEASSTNNDRSVKTLRTRKERMIRLATKKIKRPRRIVKGVGGYERRI